MRNTLFKKLIVPLHKDVFLFIMAQTNNEHLSKDIAQSTMEKAFINLEQVREVESHKSWVMQIAQNELMSFYREQRKFNIIDSVEQNIEVIEQVADLEENIYQKLISEIDSRNIIKALQDVPAIYQEVLRLHLIGSMRLIDVAEALDVNYNTIKTRYNRGIKILKQNFDDLDEGRELSNAK